MSGFELDRQIGWPRELFLDTTTIDLHICSICLGVLREAVETPCCGHMFCEWCLSRWYMESQTCPCCREPATRTTLKPALWHRRIINQLKMSCPLDCSWQGDLQGLRLHQVKCPLVACACKFCGERAVRRITLEHEINCPSRLVMCEQCKYRVVFQEMSNHIDTVCPETLIGCPNFCCTELKMPRRNMVDHLMQECPHQTIRCPFAVTGCGATPRRCDTKTHCEQNMLQHALSGLVRVNRQMLQMSERLSIMERQSGVHLMNMDHSMFPGAEEIRDMERAVQTFYPTIIGPSVGEELKETQEEARHRFIDNEMRRGTRFFHCRLPSGTIRKVEIVDRNNQLYKVAYLDPSTCANDSSGFQFGSETPQWVSPMQIFPWGIYAV